MDNTCSWGVWYQYNPDFNDNEYSALLEEMLWELDK